MTATDDNSAADHAYFRAIEEVFIRLRGAPLLLSPTDWQIARGWHRTGIPLDLVCSTLEELFRQRAEAGKQSTVRSLKYCQSAVERAWAARQELAAPAARGERVEMDIGARLLSLATALPDSLPGRDRLHREILELEGGMQDVEHELSVLDRKVMEELRAGITPEGTAEIERHVEAVLVRLESRLPVDERPAVRERLFDQAVRRRARLPVLSLFSPEAQGEI
ncbi:MAG: hypothetical protein EP299_11650 [Acidobacteria bacterium]|nr:MAG: hypothetical protein EP299_11650 [Acidobacteriota bacterium]